MQHFHLPLSLTRGQADALLGLPGRTLLLHLQRLPAVRQPHTGFTLPGNMAHRSALPFWFSGNTRHARFHPVAHQKKHHTVADFHLWHGYQYARRLHFNLSSQGWRNGVQGAHG